MTWNHSIEAMQVYHSEVTQVPDLAQVKLVYQARSTKVKAVVGRKDCGLGS